MTVRRYCIIQLNAHPLLDIDLSKIFRTLYHCFSWKNADKIKKHPQSSSAFSEF
jgi:hypothetical protein